MLTKAELAAYIDHTLLRPDATDAQVRELVAQAEALGVYAVCISPARLTALPDSTVRVASVCGFPSGQHVAAIKAAEAARAVTDGADEIDMVIDLGALRTGRLDLVGAEIRAVRVVTPDTVLKVIIESAALTTDQIVAACQVAEGEGADYVKTSTGFHPAGGASVHAVRLMAQTVGGRLGVKASGGIRTAADALAMVESGATRLGLSASAAILAELGA